MIFRSSRPRNSITKYYLRRWYHLDKNISNLDESEEKNIKILYGALKNLEADERKLLADKYRVAKKPHRTDLEMAEEYGMSVQAYMYKRVKIEDKLRPFIIELKDKYTEETPMNIDVETLNKRLRKQEKEKAEFMAMIEEQAREKYKSIQKSNIKKGE